MGKNRKRYPLIEKVEIQGIAAEGKAFAKIDDKIIFVPLGAPGDIVDIQINKKRRKFSEGYITNFIKKSDIRTEPFCEHFGVCGGCKWQHIPYEKQLDFKQQNVIDALTRIGKLTIPELNGGLYPILGSEKTQFYRNKLEFSFSNKRWMTYDEIAEESEIKDPNALGFHIPGMFDKILDIKKCWLQNDISNKLRNCIRNFCIENKYSFFDIRAQDGLMRNIIIRTSSTGEVMLIVVFHEDDHTKIKDLLHHIDKNFPDLTSLLYIVNRKANDTIFDQDVFVYKERDYIYEEMEDLKFKIGPKSFYQTNSEQAYNLYKTVRSFAELNENDLVYDLYTGTGTIAQFVAKSCKHVIGIEFVPEAIADAKTNAELNKLGNTEFYAGDIKNILNHKFIQNHGTPDVIITDPPRAGMHKDVVETILFAKPKKIVYVSCNPATQARDLELLCVDYDLVKVQPVDMFPHTHHIENVVLLKKKE